MAPRSSAKSLGLGWLAGVILCVIFYYARWAVLPYYSTSNWGLVAIEIAGALAAVVPGLTAGYWAGRSGAFVGAAAGFLGNLAAPAMVYGMPLTQLTTMFIVTELAKATAAAATNGVSGVAGTYFRSLPSNTTVERDARKSGARPSP